MSVLIGSGADIAGVQFSGTPSTGQVWSVQFFQQNDGISFGSAATLDDLPTGDCTLEGWFKIPNIPAVSINIITKLSLGTNGWLIYMDSLGQMRASLRFTGNGVNLIAAVGIFTLNQWHHVAVDFDIGTITGRLFVDGILRDTDAGAGVYSTAAAVDCIVNGYTAIGTGDDAFTIGPIRISSYRRYTGASFTPPNIWEWPEADTHDRLITSMGDGAGATVTDYSGNGNDGTITFGANTRWILSDVE